MREKREPTRSNKEELIEKSAARKKREEWESKREERRERREKGSSKGSKGTRHQRGKQKGSERKMARGEGNVGTPDQRGDAPKVGLLYEFPERKPG